jgi:tripartite-type tricarboxylate transporter receptor subunit TctC
MCVWMSMHSIMAVNYRIRRMRRLLIPLMMFATTAWAQPWPSRPVKIIVPFAPGGTADTLGRLVAQKVGESLKVNFVVENRGGAGGALGSDLAAKAAPDGYTLVVSGIASHVIAPLLPQGTPYDPVKDFTHIAMFGGPPAVLAVHPSVEAKDLRELVALAKSKPLSYGSPGNGTQGQLVAELFKQRAGIDLQHVPYKGASGAVTDLIAGHIPVVSTTLTTAASQIRAGRARALAISAPARLPEFPDVPTYREMGYPDLVATVWFSLSGPAHLPDDIVTKLNGEVNRALDLPEVRERLKPEGIVPQRMNAREFGAYVAEEVKRWAPVVKASGAKND